MEDPQGVLLAAREAQILLSADQRREFERFFDAWTWGPVAASFVYGYETDSFSGEIDTFLDGRAELGEARPEPELGCFGDVSDSEQILPVAPDRGLSSIARRRRSRRTFDNRPMQLSHLAACLQSAFGKTGENDYEVGPSTCLTSAPAPGGINSYDAFVLVQNVEGHESGTYHYVPERHALARMHGVPVPFDLLFGRQQWCAGASCAIVLVADLRRQAPRYKFPTTIGAVLVEAGARVQLILLQAEELALSAVVVGMTGVGAFDREMACDAGLPGTTSMVMPACAVLLGLRSTD